ncbi:MAG: hypothetical protein ABIA63_02310, partial [bacterium]
MISVVSCGDIANNNNNNSNSNQNSCTNNNNNNFNSNNININNNSYNQISITRAGNTFTFGQSVYLVEIIQTGTTDTSGIMWYIMDPTFSGTGGFYPITSVTLGTLPSSWITVLGDDYRPLSSGTSYTMIVLENYSTGGRLVF